MPQSDLLVSNLALRLMGSRATLTALSDTSVEGVACNAMVDDCKRALLRMHPWNFATKRKKLQPYQNFEISNVTFVSSEQIEVTHATATFATGDYVTVTGVSGASAAVGTWEVASVPTPGTVVRLTAIGVTTSDILGTYLASDSDYIRRSPAYDFPYLYALPSDQLRILAVDELSHCARWKREGGFILADSASLEIRYLFDVSDYTSMDPSFYQVLAHYLAYNLCDHLSASDAKKQEIHAYLYGGDGRKGALPQARFLDASEGGQQFVQADDWIVSRNSIGLPV